MKNKAFSMLELLIIAAILALLGLILFPLIQQSRYKFDKEICASNLKFWSTAFNAYLQENNNNFPLAMAWDGTKWLWNQHHAVPPDWRVDKGEEYANWQRVHWANSVKPYIDYMEFYACPVCPEVKAKVNYDFDEPVSRPRKVSYTYNGILHTYNYYGIVVPSQLTLMFEGRGKAAMLGFAVSGPMLACSSSFGWDENTMPCLYTPKKEPRGYFAYIAYTMWVHNNKAAFFLSVDGIIKLKRLGIKIEPEHTNPYHDPFTGYTDKGIPNYAWWDGFHPWLFRPAYTFDDF